MTAVFDPAEGVAQSWGINEPITPVYVPMPTGISGPVRYEADGLPAGVAFNPDTLVIFGEPAEAGSGTFTLTATDDDGASEWTFPWSVAVFVPRLEVAPFENLDVVIGQQVDLRLPVPSGGIPPYTWTIVSPVFEDWPYDPRLPQGITFTDGRFSGTPTDTQDNQGRIWYDRVGSVNRTTEGNPVNRLRPIWNIPSGIENRFFDYETSRYDIDVLLSRTRPQTGQAYGPDAPLGGLRFRTSSPSGHGRLDNRNVGSVPHCNPFIRITSVSNPDRQAYFYLAGVTTAPRDAWSAFYSPDYPVNAPWFDTSANTGDDFRVEIGTEQSYPITIRVADSVGSALEQTIRVNVLPVPPGSPPVPVLLSSEVTAHLADLTFNPPPAGAVREYSFVRAGNPPVTWGTFDDDRLIIPRLATDTEYALFVRYRNPSGAGPALYVPIRTISAAGIVEAPAPLALSLDNNPGDRLGILDGKLRAAWEPADITTQVLSYDYLVELASLPEGSGRWTAMPASTASTRSFTIEGLRNGTEYRVGIRPRNDAGPGRAAFTTGTPTAGREDAGYARWQFQIMMDLTGPGDDPRGAPWFDLASRCYEAEVFYGREARQQLTATGIATFILETSDDFINIEGTSLYRLDDLQNRVVHLNEVLETPGGLRRRTRFAGLVETAQFRPFGQESVIEVKAVDFFGLMAQDHVVVGQDLPAQTTGERIKLLLDAAGWEPDGTGLRSYNPELIDEGSKICAYIPVAVGASFEANLLDELNLVTQSEGGRMYLGGGGDNRGGTVRFDGASPVTNFDGRISDQRTNDPAVIQFGGQPVVESEDSFLYNDFELSYPGGDEPVRFPANDLSVRIWGKRTYDLYTEVRTDRESTEALIRGLRKQYGTPRRWISSLPVEAHFQTAAAARLIQDLDLSKSLLVDYRPPGSKETISGLQRVDSVRINYKPLDRQYVALNLTLGLLIPEASAYWILDVPDADRYDSDETYLAPRRNLDPPLSAPGGRLPGGWRVTDDREFQIVSANRFDALLAQQVLPVYRSEGERDEVEGDPGTDIGPVDGRGCVIIETSPTGIKAFWLYEYSGPDFQWLRRGQLTQADANPTTQTLLLGDSVRGILGLAAGNVLAGPLWPGNLRA